MPQEPCPSCGHVPASCESPVSNSQRDIALRIPEAHWPIFKMVFDQMNVKFGMHGLGEFANVLPAYRQQLPLDPAKFRFFDDVSLAYLFLGFERGYRLTLRIEEGGAPDYAGTPRVRVIADLAHPDGHQPPSLELSGGVVRDIAEEVCAYLEEAAERLSGL